MFKTITTLLVLLFASAAHAYIGPGAGISVLGSIFSIIIGVILAIAAIVMWPLRRLLKKKKASRNQPIESDAPGE